MNIKTQAIIVGVLLALCLVTYYVAFGPEKITVNSKHWKCVATRPVGIGAECTALERKL